MAVLPGRAGDDRITAEQAALRRVATLVARGAPPEEVFAAVTEEAGRLLGADYISMARYDPDGARTVVASSSSTGPAFPVGAARLGGWNVSTLVFQTGRAARIDDYAGASGPAAQAAREFGLRAVVGVPVSVEGEVWGEMAIASRTGPLPAGTEAQLARFTELAATAIANAQARMELRGFAEEQAALRRVATLVARAAAPEEVFAAVTEEARRLLGATHATMSRYDPDGARTLVASWSSTGPTLPVGSRVRLGGQNVSTMVFQTHRPARIDEYAGASGPVAELARRDHGLRAAVGVPVSVEGQLWGVMTVGSHAEPLPAGTEAELARFTELAAIAIANAEAQAALVRAESELRALQTELQQAERLQTVGQLTSSIAHDFSNLLAVIVGYTELAEDVTGDRGPELDRILGDIRGAADRAVHLSGDLLSFSRRVQANTEDVDLNTVVRRMMDLLIMSMSGRAEVIFEPSPILPAVRADRGQLEQVLLNLAVNARDAMPEGGTLTIRTSTADFSTDSSRLHPGTKPGRYAELAFQDTGIGMTTDVREKIFERFFTTKPGTGLGLYTVHGIITGAGGTIEVDSLEGRGTTFRIYLPAALKLPIL